MQIRVQRVLQVQADVFSCIVCVWYDKGANNT